MPLKDVLKGLLGKKLQAASSSTSGALSLDRGKRRKAPSASGIATQFEDIDTLSPHKQLVIGLDFGTAFTKIVVGEERFKLAIPLRGVGDMTSDYLLPTVFWSSSEGECSIDSPAGDAHTDLKMSLIGNDLSKAALRNAAVYLALVLRRVRAFIFDHKRDIYGGNYIDWLINVGLPTDSYHDDMLSDAYRKVLRTAWMASTEPGLIEITRVEGILSNRLFHSDTASATSGILHPEAISLFPEFVAQITGYVRSPLRQPDLHLFVDVGAGTLDVTVFNVHEEDKEDKFPIFAKAVERLGTRFLTRHRIEGTSFREEKKFAPFAPVPAKEQFARLMNTTVSALIEIDEPFRNRVSRVVGELLDYTKRKRYPMSTRWSNGIPIFLCGGGANCDFYAEIFHPENGKLLGFPLRMMKLPRPDQLEANAISSVDYDRISVAYGLSFDPYDIGEIVRESDVSDVEEDSQHDGRSKVGTVFCPHCSGTGGLHHPCRYCDGIGFIK